MHFGENRRSGLDAPAHGSGNLLEVGGGELEICLIERGIHAVAEDVVVLEERVAQRLAQHRGDFDKAAVAFPSPGVEQFLSLLFGQSFPRAAALVVIGFVLVAAPVSQTLLQRRRDLGELVEEFVTELLVEGGAQVFVAGGEAQRFDGLERALVVQAQRALDCDLPVAEGGILEDLRLGRFLEVEERAADALDVLARKLTVLLAEVLAQRLEPLGRVDELHLPLAVRWLLVRKHPNVGRDAGVVEEVKREGDDGLEPEHPAHRAHGARPGAGQGDAAPLEGRHTGLQAVRRERVVQALRRRHGVRDHESVMEEPGIARRWQ